MTEPSIPHQSYLALFLRFLRFGCLAWGGPVAQIAMIRKELVEEEKWIGKDRFNRALAVYQVLPGPEAHELCVYFGMLARGRPGAVLAGLGFMLPGLVLMLALSWVYVRFGLRSPYVAMSFAAMQVVVVALVVRAVERIGRHAVTDGWLWGMAIASAVAQFFGLHFVITLGFAGLVYPLLLRRRFIAAALTGGVAVGSAVAYLCHFEPTLAVTAPTTVAHQTPSLGRLFLSGLSAGMLTFGGAYTAIPILRRDAVIEGGWISDAQFLDGLALSGILPAPFIIFATFMGYIGGGWVGALLVTAGVFIPAFAFTLIGHDLFERIVQNERVHAFLAGVTAGVVGLIAVSALVLFRSTIGGIPAGILFAAALAILYLWRAKWAIAALVLTAGALGLVIDFR